MANLRITDFDFGAPKLLAFKAAGRNVPTKIPGADPQVCFETISGDKLYLDETPAGDIERELQELGIAPGVVFRLTRHKTTHGASRFSVERAAPGRDSGGHNVPARSDAYAEPAPRSPVASYAEAKASAPITPASMKFCAAMMSMVDAMRETKAYAQRCGIDMSTEDLRCLAVTAFINDSKGGR